MTAAFDSNVDISIELGFGSGALTASPTWEDVSAYGRSVEIRRGRSSVLDRFDAGTATVVFDNDDGRFDPNNTAGAYSPNVKVGVPIRIRATYDGNTYGLFRGVVERWPVTFPHKGKTSVVEVPCVDGFKALSQLEITDKTYSKETADTRIGNVLDDVGWPAGLRDIATGLANVQAFDEDGTVLALSHMQDVADSEVGVLFIDGDGNVVFQNRLEFAGGATSQGTFGPGNIPIDDVVPSYDDDFLYNDIRITREDGDIQQVVDATSVSLHGTRVLERDVMPNATNSEALNSAEWLSAKYSDVVTRIEQLTLKPRSDPANLWPQALGRELRGFITVQFDPPSGDQFSQESSIQHITHSFNRDRQWTTAWQLAPLATLETQSYWVLGTSTLGTSTVLA